MTLVTRPRATVLRLTQLFTADRSLAAGLVGSWALAVLFTGVRIPTVNPAAGAEVRPMESAAVLMLAAIATLQAAALEVRAPWLVVVSPRRLWPLRLVWLVGQITLGAAAATIATQFMPAGVTSIQVIGVWLTCLALAVTGMVVSGITAATLAPAGLLVMFSFGHDVPPWQTNIVYNPALVGPLWVTASVAMLAASTLFVSIGTAGQRMLRRLG